MNKDIKVIIITISIFTIGMIGLYILNVTKLSTLWLLICIVFELILSKLFANHTIPEKDKKQ